MADQGGNGSGDIGRLWRDFEIVAGFLFLLIGASFGFLWRYIGRLWGRVDASAKGAGDVAVWNVRMYATKDDINALKTKMDTLEKHIQNMLREQRQDIAEMISLRNPVKPDGKRNDRKRNRDIEINEE